MSINLTLITQMIVFALLVWFTMKFVWPIILGAMQERETKIAAGLAAAEAGQKSLTEAGTRVDEVIREARGKANQIIDQGSRRSNEMVEAAKATAAAEGQRIVADARQETQVESNRAREQLRKEVAALAVAGASKLLGREIDAKAHADLLDKLAFEIERG